MGDSSKVVLGLILGGMMSIDMGGPFNKAAYVFGTASIAAGNYDIMAAVILGGMVPPCAIALSTLLFKDKLTKEEVDHIAHLARIGMSDSERETFQVELKKLLDEVKKIVDIKGYDDELMITPSSNKAKLREDEVGEMISAKEALANAPAKNGNFVEVPVMINE